MRIAIRLSLVGCRNVSKCASCYDWESIENAIYLNVMYAQCITNMAISSSARWSIYRLSTVGKSVKTIPPSYSKARMFYESLALHFHTNLESNDSFLTVNNDSCVRLFCIKLINNRTYFRPFELNLTIATVCAVMHKVHRFCDACVCVCSFDDASLAYSQQIELTSFSVLFKRHKYNNPQSAQDILLDDWFSRDQQYVNPLTGCTVNLSNLLVFLARSSASLMQKIVRLNFGKRV